MMKQYSNIYLERQFFLGGNKCLYTQNKAIAVEDLMQFLEINKKGAQLGS